LAAYKSRKEEVGVSVKSIYDKLAGTELKVTRELVARTAQKMRAIHDSLNRPLNAILPGYEVRILDGSHLRATERRLDVHRMINGAPLPGQALVILDPQRMLIEDMIPCECGHTQERRILHELIDEGRSGIVWVVDRNFCTVVWMQTVASDKSWFVVRAHASVIVTEDEPLRRVGKTETGIVFEQKVTHIDRFGTVLKMRRVVIELFEPTSDGDTQIVLFSNLPDSVTALQIAYVYGCRWTIEGVFAELTLSLNGEINTLAYPPAAILAYALALVSYNVLSIVKAAIAVVQSEQVASQMSTYYMAEEVASTMQGMNIAIPSAQWESDFGKIGPRSLASCLKQMAKHVEIRRYRKQSRGPKTPRPKRTGSYQHVSTQKLLNQRRC
jgi:IS4 transposase